jgi:signal peptidase I
VVKAIIKYITILALLLFTIWSQSWMMCTILLISCLLFWKPSLFEFIFKGQKRLSSTANSIIEWLLAAIASILLLWFVNSYILNFYTIKASSMLPLFYNNELIVINKLAYGPTINADDSDDYRRLNGYSQINKGDIIAFFFPEGDTSFVDFKGEDYHFIKRQFETTHHYNPILDGKVKGNAVSQRQVYIKRLIALPGDTLQISNGDYYINNTRCDFNNQAIALYRVKKGTSSQLVDLMIKTAITSYRENDSQLLEIQPVVIKKNNWDQYLQKVEEVLNMPNTNVFPFKANYLWNASWLGPIIMPTKGKTVRLTQTNLPLYKRIIEAYEQNSLAVIDEQIFINNKKVSEYTFKLNYYWVGGNNKKHSFDSRYWGFVPENHIIGRVEKL